MPSGGESETGRRLEVGAGTRSVGRPRELTEFGQFVKDHHINARWLAEQLGVSPSRVSRWCWGLTGMSQAMRVEIMEVLRQRAREQEPPEGLLDDQPEPPPWVGGSVRDGTPFDRALRRA